jgi:hypothetical protein
MTVFVLWEDKATGSIESFGPHAFLIACVASRLVVPARYKLMRSKVLGGKSCRGNSNVLRELGNGPLWDSVMRVVAVVDTDRIHDRITGISSRRMISETAYESWSNSETSEVRKHAPQAAQAKLEVCFLDRNLETLLSLVGRGMPELPRALGKDLLARDKILHRAAADEDLMRKACAEMPSWEHLVTTVTELIQGNMSLIGSGWFQD